MADCGYLVQQEHVVIFRYNWVFNFGLLSFIQSCWLARGSRENTQKKTFENTIAKYSISNKVTIIV